MINFWFDIRPDHLKGYYYYIIISLKDHAGIRWQRSQIPSFQEQYHKGNFREAGEIMLRPSSIEDLIQYKNPTTNCQYSPRNQISTIDHMVWLETAMRERECLLGFFIMALTIMCYQIQILFTHKKKKYRIWRHLRRMGI